MMKVLADAYSAACDELWIARNRLRAGEITRADWQEAFDRVEMVKGLLPRIFA